MKLNLGIDHAIGVIRLFPGMTRSWFASQLRSEGLKAVVLETYGSGNAPSHDWFLEELELAARHGLVIVSVSQCRGGMVEQGVYATSAGLERIGVVGGNDLTVEAALVKLMHLFGKKLSANQVSKQMSKPICGELTV